MRLMFTVLMACCFCTVGLAQKKVDELPGFYKNAKEGAWAKFSFKLRSGPHSKEFDVKYTLKSVGVISVTVETERLLKGQKKGRTLPSNFKIEKGFKTQLLKIKEQEGLKDLLVRKCAVVGTEKVKIGSTEYLCQKIEFHFNAKNGTTGVDGKETYWYNEKIPVMKIARITADYKINLTRGQVGQRIDLRMIEHSK